MSARLFPVGKCRQSRPSAIWMRSWSQEWRGSCETCGADLPLAADDTIAAHESKGAA